MSNVRLYDSDPVPMAESPSAPAPNPQAVLNEATQNFQSGPTGAPMTSGPRMISLRRTGERPFRFHGTEICSAVGWAQKLTVWHEINLYQTTNGKIILDIRVFRKSPDEKDIFRVEVTDSLEDAISILESYDPTRDVVVAPPLDDPKVSLATLSLEGVALRQTVEQTERQFGALLGDLLHEIERVR